MASLTLLVLQCNRDFLVHKLLDNKVVVINSGYVSDFKPRNRD